MNAINEQLLTFLFVAIIFLLISYGPLICIAVIKCLYKDEKR